jgi:hypothetical protein
LPSPVLTVIVGTDQKVSLKPAYQYLIEISGYD